MVVERLPHHPMVYGLTPETSTDTRREHGKESYPFGDLYRIDRIGNKKETRQDKQRKSIPCQVEQGPII
jgi:hypothetical protein